MSRHNDIPNGRISMDDLARRARISRRQAEHWTYLGWLEHTKEEGRVGRVHYDPNEARVAFVINLMTRFDYDAETFQLVLKKVREWETDEYFLLTDRVFVDLEGI